MSFIVQSLLTGLLRLTELEDGVISIDGIDVSAVGLNALRYAETTSYGLIYEGGDAITDG